MIDIHINIGDIFETHEVIIHEVIIEVYIEDKLTNRQQMQAPKEMLIMNFIQTAKQMRNDPRPIKLKMIRAEVIWDKFYQKQRVMNNEIELKNNAMVAWEANKNE